MRPLSAIAALMIVNVYAAVLIGLTRRAVDPEVDWTLGFFALMLFFCFTAGPMMRLVKNLALRPSRAIGRHER